MTFFKKTLYTLLAAVMLFTALATCGIFAAAAGNTGVFSRYDDQRRALLEGSPRTADPDRFEEKTVLAFKKGVTEQQALSMLARLGAYRPLAYTSRLVFAVAASPEHARAVCGDRLLYCVANEENDISLCADAVPYELTAIGSSPENGLGKGVTIAILDSGVDRSLPCFENADILPGWDAVEDAESVDTDDVGHGTMICGIICAAGYGVAQGATVLPVRITSDGKKIKTSDLVESLYYAADSGADVINMSFGGYAENAAESEAVAYAAEKGCVLVSSAGNEGADPEYAGRYSYPASFDNVISVASFGANGKVCPFSQFNDKVDICAPGELLTLFAPSEEGQTVDLINGTSFSTAFVSAAACLCMEKRGEKINSAFFEKMLEYASASGRDDRYGWGKLNIKKLLSCADMPFVEGVRRNEVYFSETAAVFENAAATLDGEPYESGDPIFSQGRHTLTVADERGSVELSFAVDTVPLTYDTEKGEGWISFVFDRGSATLDGESYRSGSHITSEGEHVFALTGPYGNTVGSTFTMSFSLPVIYGVENGVVYGEPLHIRAVGTGRVYLDGVEFDEEIFVRENGGHTLLVTDISGETRREIDFALDGVPGISSGMLPANCAYFDPDNNYVACWDAGSYTVSVCSAESLDTIERELEIPGSVIDIAAQGDALYVFHSRGWKAYDRRGFLENEQLVDEFASEEDILVSACVYGGEVFYSDEYGFVHRGAYDETPLELGSRSIAVASRTDGVLAYSAYTPGEIYEYKDGAWRVLRLAAEPGYFGLTVSEHCVCVGGDVYTESFDTVNCRLPDGEKALYCSDDCIITGRGVYSARTGALLGEYRELLTAASSAGDRLALIGGYCTYMLVDPQGLYGASRRADALTGEPAQIDDFTVRTPLAGGADIADAVYDRSSDSVLAILQNDNRLYHLDSRDGSLIQTLDLRYVPLKLRDLGSGAAVIFDKSRFVYLTKEKEYIAFPEEVGDICLCGGEYFAVCGGSLVRRTQKGKFVTVKGLDGVRSVCVYENGVCAALEDKVLFYDPVSKTVVSQVSSAFRPALYVSERYVFAGSDAFSGRELKPVSHLDEIPLCSYGDAAFCESGLYRVSKGKLIAKTDLSGSICVVTPSYRLFVFGKTALSVIDIDCDPTEEIAVQGVAEGGSYTGSVYVYVPSGKAYLDGESVDNGFTVDGAGMHKLRVTLPFGLSRTVDFKVLRQAEKIILSAYELRLSVGQSVTLTASVYPDNAGGKILFASDSPCVTVSEKGRIEAVSDGTAAVTAYMEGADVFAECRVTVTDSNLINTDKTYSIDRDAGVLYGVAPRTFILDLVMHVTTGGTLEILGPDGANANGDYAFTGMTLRRRDENGKITDKLTVAVTGDADGDGRVTAGDVDALFAHLSGSKRQKGAALFALDVNGNGKVTSSDLKAMYKTLEFSAGAASGDSLGVTVPDFVFAGGLIPIAISPGKNGVLSFSGVISFSPDEAAYAKADTAISEIYVKEEKNKTYFCVPASGRTAGSPLTLWLRVAEDAQSVTLDFGPCSVYTARGLESADGLTLTVPVRAPGERFFISAPGSDLEFDRSVYVYDVTVPEGTAEFITEISCPAGCYVYSGPSALASDGITEIGVTLVSPDGKTHYVFRVKHGEMRKPDTDSSLADITVNGAELVPPFSPDITEYSVYIPKGEAASFTAVPNSDKAAVTTETGYGENGIIYTFICTAEDGGATVYTVEAIYRSEESEPVSPDTTDEPSSEEEESSAPEAAESRALSETPVSSAPAEETDAISEQSRDKEKDGAAGMLPYAVAAIAVMIPAAAAAVIARRKAGNGKEDKENKEEKEDE